jgi:hypothetical protein
MSQSVGVGCLIYRCVERSACCIKDIGFGIAAMGIGGFSRLEIIRLRR